MNPILLGILKKAPELIAIAKQLADGVKAGRRSAQLGDRVGALEQNEERQAELVREIARQLDAMTALMKVISVRVALALGCSVVALALAVAALMRD